MSWQADDAALLIDFGSTFTKLTAVNLAPPRLLGQAQAPTTAADVAQGLEQALHRLAQTMGRTLPRWRLKLACSSAAGGLRLVAVGLVPKLTAEAARRAALGAGAKIEATYAYQLTTAQVAEIKSLQPDILLLAGGTDGGNTEVLLHNAQMLAAAGLSAPIVLAGNKEAAGQAATTLQAAGLQVTSVDNVMPRLNELRAEPARQAIRQVFMKQIVHAKGMTAISRQLDAGLLPTPAAVLKGAQLLADGYGEVPGVGPLVVVDVGGATTDVHSIGYGEPTEEGVVRAGLAEPYAKRTVEGDLGLRHSAPSLLAAAAENIQRRSGRQPGDLQSAVKFLAANPDYVPPSADKAARQLDGSLAAAAIGLAMGRHAGYITQRATAAGLLRQQHGKDLRQTRFLIGTGGIFRSSPRPWPLLDQAWGQSSPTDAAQDGTTPLIPQEPQLAVDGQYLLAPLGMLSTAAPGPALKLLRRSLKVKGSPGQADTGDKTN